MPELTVAEIEKAIDDGRLTLLSIDTSVFSQYQNGHEHGLLQRLAQFEASDVDVVLSDVVVREVRRKMVETAVRVATWISHYCFGIIEEPPKQFKLSISKLKRAG